MKYRVKYQCYWYNTGAADNHYYVATEDFDTLAEAENFAERVVKQKQIYNLSTSDKDWITKTEEWENSENFIEVENGFIDKFIGVVKYYPPVEEKL